MASNHGRVYGHSNKAAKLFRVLGILLLALVVLFFYLYFQWKKYIVYTDDGLYLDLPIMHDGDSPSGGSSGTVKAGFAEPAEEETQPEEPVPEETVPNDAEQPEEGTEPEGETEPEDGEPAEGGTEEPESGEEPGAVDDAPAEGSEPQPEEDSGTDKNGVRNSF